MKRKKPPGIKSIAAFSMMALLLIAIFIAYAIIGPEDIIKGIGIRNGYIIAFIISFFAGFSAFTTLSFYSVLIGFLSGGLNPVLLALVSGSSLALGDMFMFYFGQKGRDIISGKLDRSINRMSNFLIRYKLENYIHLISYIYISFLPLPNDWLLLFLASVRYPQKRMNIIIILGDFTHASLLIFLISKGLLFLR